MRAVLAVRAVFGWSFWRQRIRLLVCLSYLVLSSTLALVVLWGVSAEKGRYLYYPPGWAAHRGLREKQREADNEEQVHNVASMGGGSLGVLPLNIANYRVHEGDTLSGIAERFGLDLDTVASLNREWGSGVHLIRIGEAIRVPNQDGIFVAVGDDLEATCARYDLPPELILNVNGVSREQLARGTSLFFPGVQHTGIERSVVTGTAFLRPVAGYLTSPFGYRADPFTGELQFHRGIDLAAPLGTPVRAALDGRVVVVGRDPSIGNYVLISHQVVGFSSLYGHLSQIYVKYGAIVTRGQKIGTVGITGRSTGPHLHFEIRRSGVPVNALGLISSRY
jgi:murein DD-endopeptidase MepM/ murein hydrolase activator NlpD